MQLYPMDFEEFLMAMGEQQLLNILLGHDYELVNSLHEKCKDLLRQYYYVGGMPEVVKSYIDNGRLNQVRALQNEILSNYASDFSKRAPKQEVPQGIARHPLLHATIQRARLSHQYAFVSSI